MVAPTAPFGTPSNVTTAIGPGKLWLLDYGDGSPEKALTGRDTPMSGVDGAYMVGYTDAGSEYQYAITSEGIPVAEEVEDIGTQVTGVSQQVAFTMAEPTARNLQAALNGGVERTALTDPVGPPIPGQEKRLTIVLDANSGARWVFRKVLNGDTTTVPFVKGPDKHQISATFKVEKVDANPSVRILPSDDGLV